MTEEFDPNADAIPLGRLTATLRCQKCGSNEVAIPDDANDDSRVICSTCGNDCARWGDVQAAINEAAAQKVEESLTDALGDAFDGIDGISFKKIE